MKIMYHGVKLPKNVRIGNDKIVKKTKSGKEIYSLPESEQAVKELLIDLKDEEKEIDLSNWMNVKRKKNTRQAAILTFVSDFISKKGLSHEHFKEMVSLINIGLFVKWLDVEMVDGKVTRMKGLKYRNGKFLIDVLETEIAVNYKNEI